MISAPSLGEQSRAVNTVTYADFGVDNLVEYLINGKHLFEKELAVLEKTSNARLNKSHSL